MSGEVMTILNKDVLIECGPYLDWCYRDKPLVPIDLWPSYNEYEKDIFFYMSIELLECFCHLTNQHSPFDPYDLINLTDSKSLKNLFDKFKEWINIIESLSKEEIIKKTKYSFFFERTTNTSADEIRRDLLDTLKFIIEKLNTAINNGHTITIVGI